MSYLRAVLNNNHNLEIKSLKTLIKNGTKLKKNVKQYKKELRKYNGSLSNTVNNKKIYFNPIKTIKKKRKKDVKKNKNISKVKLLPKNRSKYTINSVISVKNAIIINFNTYITKEYIKFFEKKLKNANQDIYDIKGSFKDAHPTKLRIKGVKQIVIKQEKTNVLRILFEDRYNLKTIYLINKKQLIIKVLNLKNKSNRKLKKTTIIKRTKFFKVGQNRIVVIDAGHGGKDSGAIGTNKKYEKIVVLNVAKYVQSILKKRGYKVYLTRNNDTFIKVRNRTILANKKKANIFISIHANAAHKNRVKEAHGIETFFLSPARSERAKRAAARENKSDIRKMNYSSKNTLLTILNQHKITASNKLAIDIQRNILNDTRKMYKDVFDGGVREGPFWVLVGALMPSVLIEVGYITHPKEGKRLYKSKYQKKLAIGIANGIDAYFAKNP